MASKRQRADGLSERWKRRRDESSARFSSPISSNKPSHINVFDRTCSRRLLNKIFMLKLRTRALHKIELTIAADIREGRTISPHCTDCGFLVCGCARCNCAVCKDGVFVALSIRRCKCNPTGSYREYSKKQWIHKISQEYQKYDGLSESAARLRATLLYEEINSLPYHKEHVESDLDDFDFGPLGRYDTDDESDDDFSDSDLSGESSCGSESWSDDVSSDDELQCVSSDDSGSNDDDLRCSSSDDNFCAFIMTKVFSSNETVSSASVIDE